MQNILDRLISQLIAKGMSSSEARNVAIKKLQQSGNLQKGSTALTPKGVQRTALGPAGRAKDRAAKTSGHKTSDYKYSPTTNRAILRRKK